MPGTSIILPGRSFPSTIALRTPVAVTVLLLLLFLSSCAKNRVTYSPHPSLDAAATRNALKSFYSQWKGVPYRMGGMSQSAIDCSGLTVLAYRSIFGVQLPRTAEEQARYGIKISQSSLQPGDLVFFKTGFSQRHVGIFLENDTFIHVSTSKGVMTSHLDEPYWQKNFWKAARIYNYRQTASY